MLKTLSGPNFGWAFKEVSMTLGEEITNFIENFRKVFFRGIPRLLNDDGAYLSFGCAFSGTEALAGYRFPQEKFNGARFQSFLLEYYDPKYHSLAVQLWDLRNSVIHGFSPKHFQLRHGQPNEHFTDLPPFTKVLNADSLFLDFQAAAERYFCELSNDSSRQAKFEQHFASGRGGGLYIG